MPFGVSLRDASTERGMVYTCPAVAWTRSMLQGSGTRPDVAQRPGHSTQATSGENVVN